MTLKKIPWASYLGPSPPLPFDVTFRIIEGDSITGHIGAHRYLLATCSSVFRTEFFGLLAEREKLIDIKETSYHAFRYLIAYIYGTEAEAVDMDAEKLFAILNLAERYDILRLREEVTEQLKALQIEEENVVEVARVAEAYQHFEAVSTSVLLACSKLLKEVLVSEAVMTDFCDLNLRVPDDRELVSNLMQMVEVTVEEEEEDDDIGNIMKELFQSDDPNKVKVVKEAPANLSSVNWIDLMDPGFGIPPDVCFKIVERAGETNNNISVKEVAGEVFAHKYFLAASSDAFKERFFHTAEHKERDLKHSSPSDAVSDEDEGMGEEEEFEEDNLSKATEVGIESIEVECSSLNAFKVMINYMYGKYPTLRGAEEICEIFEIVDLAERFEVSGLEDEYRTAMFLYFREMPRWSSQPNQV